jgi:hypothetical protein
MIMAMLVAALVQEVLRPRSLLRPLVLDLVGRRLRRRGERQARSKGRTEVKAGYRVLDERPTG